MIYLPGYNALAVAGEKFKFLGAFIHADYPDEIRVYFNKEISNQPIFTVSSGTIQNTTVIGSFAVLSMAAAFDDDAVITISTGTAAESGSETVSLSSQAVVNDVTPVLPVFVSAVVTNLAPNQIVMTYSTEQLDTNSVPATTAFTPSGGKTVTNVAVTSTTVTLTVDSNYVFSDVITISYTAPLSNALQDVSGHRAANLTNAAVTNSTALPFVYSTNGNVVQDGIYTYVEWFSPVGQGTGTASGTFTVVSSGGSRPVDYAVVRSGGTGGGYQRGGGGGGAGALATGTVADWTTTGTFNVLTRQRPANPSVATNTYGTALNTTTLQIPGPTTISAAGGGGGGNNVDLVGANGASGGGASGNENVRAGGTASAGFIGGSNASLFGTPNGTRQGGGGGAGSAGGNGFLSAHQGVGGSGVELWGRYLVCAGGAGGGARTAAQAVCTGGVFSIARNPVFPNGSAPNPDLGPYISGSLAGALAFSDRAHTITTLPAALENQAIIRVSADDNGVAQNASFLSFNLVTPGKIWVGLISNRTSDPSWLDGTWTNENATVTVSTPGVLTFNLFSKQFSAGTVTINGISGIGGTQAPPLVFVSKLSGTQARNPDAPVGVSGAVVGVAALAGSYGSGGSGSSVDTTGGTNRVGGQSTGDLVVLRFLTAGATRQV